jgi:hypothetical protein
VKDEVPSSHNGARAAQLHRWRARDVSARADAGAIEDNGHPIPRLDTLDVHVATNKGASVAIVIGSPLKNDEMSRARLQVKVEVSLGYFRSAEYRDRYGQPSRDRSHILFKVHRDSDSEMLRLIDHYREQIEANDVSTKVSSYVPSNPSPERTLER